MKRLFFLIALAFSWMLSQGQMQSMKEDGWKIKWNKKTILEASSENEKANTRKLRKADLQKNYTLDIYYKEGNAKNQAEWKRSFLFFDDKDNQLLDKPEAGHVRLTSALLRKLFKNSKKIKIYTLSIPTDPDVAARVRVRRVHLATLELL
ncbi:MAG: hypothetical protein H7Y42_17790 [Chitinophagaceae bacterium]|nr:hypothetical protein [Chitinophagaceae bacterium]